MAEVMRAAVLHAPGNLRVEEVRLPSIGPHDALVRVAACGICGSDLPRVRTTGTYRFPMIPGHEISGVVAQLGPDAHAAAPNLRVGSPVAVIPLIPCRTCRYCEIGAFAQCERYDFLGSRSDGGFAEYLRVPAENLVPLPAGMAVEHGAMLEPLCVALHAARNLALARGETAAVFGLGAIGNFLAQWARALGASRVFALDIAESRVAAARAVGLADAIVSRGIDGASLLRELTGGGGVDVAFEASGSTDALSQAIGSLCAFGRLGLVGRPLEEVRIDPSAFERILRGELTLRGTWSFQFTRFPRHAWDECAEAVTRGTICVAPLVTHRIALQELPSTIEAMAKGELAFHKVLVVPSARSTPSA